MLKNMGKYLHYIKYQYMHKKDCFLPNFYKIHGQLPTHLQKMASDYFVTITKFY